jgi:cystathionine gamma-lyase
MQRDTQILEAGYPRPSTPGAFVPPVQFASTFTAPGDPAQYAFTYGRVHNPTWVAWEDALSVLDGGEAVAFASGMGATAALFGVVLQPGDVVVMPDDSYYLARVVASTWLAKIGVTARFGPTRGDGQLAALAGATNVKLLWIETPSNPHLDVCNIARLVDAAHAQGTLVAVDNTTATGYLQQPLAAGADFVVASDTKALTGHSDLVLGHVTAARAEDAATLRTWRTQQGAIPGPMETWLAHRSVATLPLRLTRQCASAMEIAGVLSANDAVEAVFYPGLPSHPAHAIAARQMRAFGPIVSFDLGTRARAESFLAALTVVRDATSFGGVHSTAERRARWGGDAVSEGFIRFSVGCEAVEDLLEDVQRGFRAL